MERTGYGLEGTVIGYLCAGGPACVLIVALVAAVTKWHRTLHTHTHTHTHTHDHYQLSGFDSVLELCKM